MQAAAQSLPRPHYVGRKRRPARRPGHPSPVPNRTRPDVRSLGSLVAEYSAIFGSAWRPATARKHRDDFARFESWLVANEIPATVDALSFDTLARYVAWLRTRPKVTGVFRGAPD